MKRWTTVIVVLSISLIGVGLLGSIRAHAVDRFKSTADSTVQEIARCLHGGGEFVLNPSGGGDVVPNPPTCEDAGRGDMKSDLPFNTSIDDVNALCNAQNDPRTLSGDVIKRVAAQKENPIGPSGIRIKGAIFCNSVDLAGLDLSYSLILDNSLFIGGIVARNLRVRGDFSLDNSLVLGVLSLNRARIDGSFYHGFGFIERQFVVDTKIDGTWHQSSTVIFRSAEFRSSAISGDLDLSNSAVGQFLLQSSQVHGGLVLNESEARCGYDVKSSEVGFVLAEAAGLGGGRSLVNSSGQPIVYSWWLRLSPETRGIPSTESSARSSPTDAASVLASAAAHTTIQRELERIKSLDVPQGKLAGCASEKSTAMFSIIETHVKSTVCLLSFSWLAWPSDQYALERHPITELVLTATNADTGLIVTFQSLKSDAPEIRSKRIFEAKGLTAGSLMFDFSNRSIPYITRLDGLKFDRIRNEPTDCEFRSIPERGSTSGTPSRRPVPPSVQEVVDWLKRDDERAVSSQPFNAFVRAFENIGEDATRLKIARADQELSDKTSDWLKAHPFPLGFSLTSVRAAFLDSIPIGFQWGLSAVADHGFRPSKVVYWVLATLVIFWCIFWLGLGIVAFESEHASEKTGGDDKSQGNVAAPRVPRLWPMGFLFLFDRLIPAYKIRDEHYSIATVYGLVSPFLRWPFKKPAKPPSNAGQPVYEISYLGMRRLVTPLDKSQQDRVNRLISVLRVIGVVWSIFLLAALKSLTD
jgi:hypothetical protein